MHLLRRGNHERAALAHAIVRPARAAASHSEPRRAVDRRGAALSASPGSRADRTDARGPRATVASDVLIGITKTDGRERSSIFSATAGVLAAYNADATRRSATRPDFDPERFVGSLNTICVTAASHKQVLAAPLVVGPLEQIRHACRLNALAATAKLT